MPEDRVNGKLLSVQVSACVGRQHAVNWIFVDHGKDDGISIKSQILMYLMVDNIKIVIIYHFENSNSRTNWWLLPLLYFRNAN